MNNILKNLSLGLLAALSVGACAKWTEPESVDFHYVTLQEKNPELYEAYMQSLRDYRASEHKVVIAKFENKAGNASGRADHITCLPDSVDYIIMMNPANIAESEMAAEMAEVREKKGQKVLYEINYKPITTAYKAYVEKWQAEHPVPEPEPETPVAEGETAPVQPENPADTMLTLNSFVRAEVEKQVALFSEYGFDGVNVKASFKNPAACTEEQKAVLMSEQEAFLDGVSALVEANKDMVVLYEGTPHYLLCHAELVNNAKYLIIPAESAVNEYECSYEMELMMRNGNIPTDRFILGVTTRSLVDKALTDGTFSGTDRNGLPRTAIIGGADWVSSAHHTAVKAGICINNISNDYFNLRQVYYNTREAISIMNPSPIR